MTLSNVVVINTMLKFATRYEAEVWALGNLKYRSETKYVGKKLKKRIVTGGVQLFEVWSLPCEIWH